MRHVSTWLDTPDDVQWLRETHLKHIPDLPEFDSAEVWGNEDCPDRVDCYSLQSPCIDDTPIRSFTYHPESNRLEQEA